MKIPKNKLLFVGFCISLSLTIATWVNIAISSNAYQTKLDNMVEGKDYQIEEVTIIKKDMKSYSSSDSSVDSYNYYLYYGNSFDEKLIVKKDVYEDYEVGDKIPAYTTNHIYYTDTLRELFPEHANTELSKVFGVILSAITILMLMIWLLNKKFKSN